jgi:toxin FitB
VIVLDTNVLSALMRDAPDPAVVQWLDVQPAESIWTTSVTVFEIRTGIDLLAHGRRRSQLLTAYSYTPLALAPYATELTTPTGR